MLLPRFSLRITLAVLTSAAAFFLVVAEAVRGSLWALGLSVAVGSVLVALFTYAIFFAICTFFGRIVGVEQVVAKTSRGGIVRETDAESTTASSSTTRQVGTPHGTEAS